MARLLLIHLLGQLIDKLNKIWQSLKPIIRYLRYILPTFSAEGFKPKKRQ